MQWLEWIPKADGFKCSRCYLYDICSIHFIIRPNCKVLYQNQRFGILNILRVAPSNKVTLEFFHIDKLRFCGIVEPIKDVFRNLLFPIQGVWSRLLKFDIYSAKSFLISTGFGSGGIVLEACSLILRIFLETQKRNMSFFFSLTVSETGSLEHWFIRECIQAHAYCISQISCV